MSMHSAVLKNICYRVLKNMPSRAFKILAIFGLGLLVLIIAIASIEFTIAFAISTGCLPLLEVASMHGIMYCSYWKEPPTALSKTLLHPAFFGGAYACAVSVFLVDVWCSTGPIRWMSYRTPPHGMQFLSAFTGTWTMPRTVLVLNIAVYVVPLMMFVGACSYHSLAKIWKEEHDALHVTAHQKAAHLARKSKTTHIFPV